MALPNLGAHTDGGTITEGQDNKETTSNNLDALLDNSVNDSEDFVTTAGGTLLLSTPQANLDLYLDTGLIRLTGSPAGAYNITIPDGDRRVAFENASGQTVTIDTVSGATTPVTIDDSTAKTLQVRGTDITVTGDDSTATGALLADGTVLATGNFDWDDNEIAKALLLDYAEGFSIATPAATIDLDMVLGNVFEVTLDQDTTFTFSNPPVSGTAGSFTLIIHQGSGAPWLATWPASVDWEQATAPTLSTAVANRDVITFFTVDGGTIWWGILGGTNFG